MPTSPKESLRYRKRAPYSTVCSRQFMVAMGTQDAFSSNMSASTESSTKEDDFVEDENSRVAAALSYCIVLLVIGVPIWWKTTEVYRVSLPYEDIRLLNDQKILIPVKVTVAVCEDRFTDFDYVSAKNSLNFEILEFMTKLDKLDIVLHWELRKCHDDERNTILNAESLADLDDKLYASDTTTLGNIKVVILPTKSNLVQNDSFYMGLHRTIYTAGIGDLRSICIEAFSILKPIVLSPLNLLEAHSRIARTNAKKPVKASMKTLPSTTAIDVTFTLILPEPDLVNVEWDISGAICAYLKPFADKLADVVKLTFKSQVFYLMALDIHVTRDSGNYRLNLPQLPHVVNKVESKLGSYISTNPGLNFVIYIPPTSQTPLQIYDETGQPSKLNAFLIPRWGGFLFFNIERKGGFIGNTSIDMHHVMGVFLPQLRSLLGIPHPKSSTKVAYSNLDSSNIRDWELDMVIRMRTIENLLSSTSTLQSLAQLLEEIGNIVIADHVGNEVYLATQKISESFQAMNDGDMLRAFLCSKESLVASEAAFFDPSMLALLYFPDDQKYAIYVPLFLPVGLPIILSVVPVLRWLRRRWKRN